MGINLGKLNDFEKNPVELAVNANKLLINKSKCNSMPFGAAWAYYGKVLVLASVAS